MGELFNQLGVHVGSLVAQAVNFGILMLVLTVFVYKPLLKLISDRTKKIEFGLKGAEEAEKKLGEIEITKTQIIREANKKGQEIIGQSEKKAGERGAVLLREAEQKSETIRQDAILEAEQKKLAEMDNLAKEAKTLVRLAIEKMVNLDPKAIDDKLINDAVSAVKKGI